MANRTYLMNHNHAAPQIASDIEETCLLGANYQVPILWIALFDRDDLVSVSVPCTNDLGEDIVAIAPTLLATTTKVKTTYAARRDALVESLSVEAVPHIAEWEDFIGSALADGTVQIDLVELWMMYDNPADFELDLCDWLEGVSVFAGAGWESLCSQASYSDEEVRRFGIRGFPWQAKLAWT